MIRPSLRQPNSSGLITPRTRPSGWSRCGDGPYAQTAKPGDGSWPHLNPRKVVEVDQVRTMVDNGAVVVCAGGGGVPVAQNPEGRIHGVEAVVDKDLTSSLLARQLHADALLLLTDVPAVQLDYGTSHAQSLEHASPEVLRSYPFAAGSMGPRSRRPAVLSRPPRSRPPSVAWRTPPDYSPERREHWCAGGTWAIRGTKPLQSSTPLIRQDRIRPDKEEHNDQHEFAVIPPDRGGG